MQRSMDRAAASCCPSLRRRARCFSPPRSRCRRPLALPILRLLKRHLAAFYSLQIAQSAQRLVVAFRRRLQLPHCIRLASLQGANRRLSADCRLTRIHVAFSFHTHHAAFCQFIMRQRHEPNRRRLGQLDLIRRTIALHSRRKVDLHTQHECNCCAIFDATNRISKMKQLHIDD